MTLPSTKHETKGNLKAFPIHIRPELDAGKKKKQNAGYHKIPFTRLSEKRNASGSALTKKTPRFWWQI